jgi:periplasmic divalent cation tolerance protein
MYCIVIVTVPRMKVAQDIAKLLVNKRLAACVNIIPSITSFYRWENRLYQDKEILMMIKTKKIFFTRLAKEIKAHHPYIVPEIIAVPIIKGNKKYLNWIKENCLS